MSDLWDEFAEHAAKCTLPKKMPATYYYLAGPMTNVAQFNFPAFERAEIALRNLGIPIWSPREENLRLGFDPEKSYEDQESFDLRDSLRADFRQLSYCKGAIFLEGWEKSRHAKIEMAMAIAMSLEIYTYLECGENNLPLLSRRHITADDYNLTFKL